MMAPMLPYLFPLAPVIALEASRPCPTLKPASYVVMERGFLQEGDKTLPVARLLQEQWHRDGTISGTVLERVGRDFRQNDYRGNFRPIGACRVFLQRSPLSTGVDGHLDAEAVFDASGIPRYSLTRFSGATVTGIWRPQPNTGCRSRSLDGTVLSQQHGLSWEKGWQPNAVVQRETWQDRRVEGVALTSSAGVMQTATYTGTAVVDSDCLATIVQRDSEGVAYNYRAVVMADGSGYFYLQTDPDDLTVGWLEKAAPRP